MEVYKHAEQVTELRQLFDKHFPGWQTVEWLWGHKYVGFLDIWPYEFVIDGKEKHDIDEFMKEFYEIDGYNMLALWGIDQMRKEIK